MLIDTRLLSGALIVTTDGRTMNGSDVKSYNVTQR
jgi:hypothetical protein